MGARRKNSAVELPQQAQAHGPQRRANAMDAHVGERIREWRVAVGLSEQELAPMVGVTSQQIHKYEQGINRVPVGRLFEIAQALRAPVAWFFEFATEATPNNELTHYLRSTQELVRDFLTIRDDRQRKLVRDLARSFATRSR